MLKQEENIECPLVGVYYTLILSMSTMFFDASTLPIQRRMDGTTQRNKDEMMTEEKILGRFARRKVFSHSLIQKDDMTSFSLAAVEKLQIR